MKRTLEDRYRRAIQRLGGPEGIARLPEDVKAGLQNITDFKAKVEALETFAHVYGKAYAVTGIEMMVERFVRNICYLAKRNGGVGAAEEYAGKSRGYLSRLQAQQSYSALTLTTAIALAEFVGESVEDLYTRDDYLTREIDERIEELQAKIAELEDEKRRTTA